MHCEQELLLCFARQKLDDIYQMRIQRLLEKNINWSIWVEEALRHRVAPLCHYHIRSMQSTITEKIPWDVLSRLWKAYQVTQSFYSWHIEQLEHVIRLLDTAKIPMLVLKGPILATTIYKDVALRPFGDLDLLIYEEHLNETVSLMVKSGYLVNPLIDGHSKQPIDLPRAFHQYDIRRKNHGKPLTKMINKNGTSWSSVIEIHHRALYAEAPFRFDSPRLFEEAELIELCPGVKVKTLSTMDHFLFLCIHLYKHATAIHAIKKVDDLRLQRFCDLYEMIQLYQDRLLNEILIERIEENHLQEPVWFALCHTNCIYESSLLTGFLDDWHVQNTNNLDRFFANSYFGPTYYRWESGFFKRLFSKSNASEAEAIIQKNKPKSGSILCQKLKPSNIDGDGAILDWGEFEEYNIHEDNIPEWQPYKTHVHAGPKPVNEQDLSAQFKIGWTENGLHFHINVKDQIVIPCSINERQTSSKFLYDQDAVCIYVGIRDYLKRMFLLLRPDLAEGVQCIQQNLEGDQLIYEVVQDAKAFAQVTEDGYEVTALIPQAFLGVGFEPNMRIGFDILIYDCDDYESGILRELVWAGGESQYGLTLRAGRYESGEIVLVE